MTRAKKLALSTLAALALAAGAAAYAPAGQLAGDPSQWGQEARKVNEYEGQHRVAGDHSQWGVAKKGSFDITEGKVA